MSQRVACISVLSGAVLTGARYKERELAKIKDLRRMGRDRKQFWKARSKKSKKANNAVSRHF